MTFGKELVRTIAGEIEDEYEERLDAAEKRAGELAADLLEERAQRRQAITERDEAREEVVRLGREMEQWKQAFGEDGLRVAKARLLDALGRPRRSWTDDEVKVRPDGTKTTRISVKRVCNGCGELLGDVTEEEIERAVAGLPSEDVRGECFTCTPLPTGEALTASLTREIERLRTIITKGADEQCGCLGSVLDGGLGAGEATDPPGHFCAADCDCKPPAEREP